MRTKNPQDAFTRLIDFNEKLISILIGMVVVLLAMLMLSLGVIIMEMDTKENPEAATSGQIQISNNL